MTGAEALTRVKGMVAWDQMPALTEDDLDQLLTDARRSDANGNTVNDDEWAETYDLNAAAAAGWELKAAKAASMISFTADGARFDRDQFLANCTTMASMYRARIVATAVVKPRRTRRAKQR